MTEKKRKTLYWVFKLLGVFISCALPIFAICEKFPIWTASTSASHSAGLGAVMIAIVLIIIFRRTVFRFLHDHLNLKHAPPITVWLVLLVIAYVMIYLGNFIRDMTTVFWMGLIGCAIGTILTYISDKFKKVE